MPTRGIFLYTSLITLKLTYDPDALSIKQWWSIYINLFCQSFLVHLFKMYIWTIHGWSDNDPTQNQVLTLSSVEVQDKHVTICSCKIGNTNFSRSDLHVLFKIVDSKVPFFPLVCSCINLCHNSRKRHPLVAFKFSH